MLLCDVLVPVPTILDSVPATCPPGSGASASTSGPSCPAPSPVTTCFTSRFCLAWRIRSSKLSFCLFTWPSRSKSLAMNPDEAAATLSICLPSVSSHTLRSCRSWRFDTGFVESQFAFHKFTHSVCRRRISSFVPELGIPRSRSFLRSALSFRRE